MIMSPPKIITSQIQCTYLNESDRLQVIRVIEDGIERTIAAGEVLAFEAHRDSHLDIYTYEIVTMTLSDRIPCRQLASWIYREYNEKAYFPTLKWPHHTKLTIQSLDPNNWGSVKIAAGLGTTEEVDVASGETKTIEISWSGIPVFIRNLRDNFSSPVKVWTE
jgi:hypothetical protein